MDKETFKIISALRPRDMPWAKYLEQIESYAEFEMLESIAEDYKSKLKVHFDPENAFIKHIKKCSEKVATWPEWKKGGSDPLTPLGIKSLSHLAEEARHVKTN